jgi:glycosyltransferase involved in cell wall biosynthesis
MDFNTGIVLFNRQSFGGAPRRFTNLFKYLSAKYPGRFFYFVDNHLYSQLKAIYPELSFESIHIIDFGGNKKNDELKYGSDPKYYHGAIPDAMEVHEASAYPRKLYWFLKNKFRQYLLFRQIEKYRVKFDIKVFMGVFSGVLPLVFYFNNSPRKAGIIFSDMDSWFSDVHSDMKKFWYRKYYSFNYALENTDLVDFLSPFIKRGVLNRGVKLDSRRVEIAPCSFTDYSKCEVGKKEDIEIAFASRLEEDKNPMMYLEAVKIISQRFPSIKFHLLGEGTLVYKMRDYIDANNLKSKVNFMFHKNPPEIFKETSIFISIQSFNNYPSQSVLEAMACGNAVIATDVGDTRFFVNENNGFLIKPDLSNLVNAMEQLITNPSLKHIGLNAREFVMKNHTIEKVAAYYINIFEKCLKLAR